jgi:mannosidase alpha-like ER degradation enhancer 1
VGHYSVRPGHTVYINDSNIFRTPEKDGNVPQRELHHREQQVQLRIFSDADIRFATPGSESISFSRDVMDLSVTGYTADFGADLSLPHILNALSTPPPSIVRPEGVPIRHEDLNRHGCLPFEHSYPDSALIVHRGKCTFLEKLLYARAASASAVIIISDNNLPISPTADADDLEAAGDLSDAAVIVLPKETGEALENMLIVTSILGSAEIRVSVDTKMQRSHSAGKDQGDKGTARVLYVNGHPLINTRLLV